MTKIRISGVGNLADARAAAAQHIDFLGLNLTPGGENTISPIKVADYMQWLSGVTIVAELRHLTEEKALRFLDLLNLKFAEILGQNALNNQDSIWRFYENDHFENTSNTVVVANPTLNQVQKYQNAFIRISPSNTKNIPIFIANGVTQFDIYLPAYKTEVEMNWDEMETLIAQIRKND